MPSRTPLDDPPITEPVPILDSFATWMRLDSYPDYVRFVFLVDHPLESGELEREIVGKVVMPRPVFERAFATYLRKRNPN